MKKKNLIIIVSTLLILLLTGCEEENLITINESAEENIQEKEPTIDTLKPGFFAYYDDKLYYWKLNDSSRSDTGINASFNDNIDSENSLVEISNDGNEKTIYKAVGSKDIVILNNKIYTSKSRDEYENSRIIYSLNLDGKEYHEIGEGFCKYILGNDIIGYTKIYGGNIFKIDTRNDSYTILKENVELIDVINGNIFYGVIGDGKYDIGVINGSDDKIIASISKNDFMNSVVTQIRAEFMEFNNERYYFYVGFRDGSANILQEVISVSVNDEFNDLIKEIAKTDLDSFNVSLGLKLNYSKQTISYQEEKDSKEITIVSLEKLASDYDIIKDDEHIISIYGGNKINDNIYFILDYGMHEANNDIGWRYSYKRVKTIYFKYDTISQELSKIYEF